VQKGVGDSTLSVLANIAWAYAVRGLCIVPLLDYMGKCSLQCCSVGVPAQHLANISWSGSALGSSDACSCERTPDMQSDDACEFRMQELATTVWSVSVLVCENHPLQYVAVAIPAKASSNAK